MGFEYLLNNWYGFLLKNIYDIPLAAKPDINTVSVYLRPDHPAVLIVGKYLRCRKPVKNGLYA